MRFLQDVPAPFEGAPLSAFTEGDDWIASPGGVTRMVRALLERFESQGRIRGAEWLALSSAGPARVGLTEGVHFGQVRLDPESMAAYGEAKGELWHALHGLPADERVEDPRWLDAGLSKLADALARRTAQEHARDPFDLFYVHDFQLLPLASRLPRGVPRLFRWHVPVRPLAPAVERYVVDRLNEYDSVIVSSERYASRLRRMGVHVPVHAIYPHLDESRQRVVTDEDVAAFEARWGLAPDDIVFAVVARLDPMKSQDVAIRALARIKDDVPKAKLVLVGGGGFSGGRVGLGLPHAARWREHLEELAAELGVADRVILTGNVPDEELDVAYTRARAVLLPSVLEGFGLAAIEGWLYGRPVVVSTGAGMAELVQEGQDGFTFPPGDDAALAGHLRTLADDAVGAGEMGEKGRETASACHLRRGTDHVWDVMKGLLRAKAARDATQQREGR